MVLEVSIMAGYLGEGDGCSDWKGSRQRAEHSQHSQQLALDDFVGALRSNPSESTFLYLNSSVPWDFSFK